MREGERGQREIARGEKRAHVLREGGGDRSTAAGIILALHSRARPQLRRDSSSGEAERGEEGEGEEERERERERERECFFFFFFLFFSLSLTKSKKGTTTNMCVCVCVCVYVCVMEEYAERTTKRGPKGVYAVVVGEATPTSADIASSPSRAASAPAQ